MYIATIKLRFSKLDQGNLQCLIEKWSKEDLDANFYFQPYELQSSSEVVAHIDQTDNTDNPATEEADVIPEAENVVKNFIFAYQNSWQKGC